MRKIFLLLVLVLESMHFLVSRLAEFQLSLAYFLVL